MSEAEAQAIRKAFAEEMAGTEFSARGDLTGSQNEILSEAGGDGIYHAFKEERWKVVRGPGNVSRARIVAKLNGRVLGCKGGLPVPGGWLIPVGWDYSEKANRDGAEALTDQIELKGWGVVE